MFLIIALCAGIVVLGSGLYLSISHTSDLEEKLSSARMNYRIAEQRWSDTSDKLDKTVDERTYLKLELSECKEKLELIEQDTKARIEDMRTRPMIACMTDNQVQILSELISVHIKNILEGEKEWIH